MFFICNNKDVPGIDLKTLEPKLVIFLDKRNSDIIWRIDKYNISDKQIITRIDSYAVYENFIHNELKDYCVGVRCDIVGWRSHPDLIAYVLENVQYTYQLVEIQKGKMISEFQINGHSLMIVSDNHIQSF